METYSRSASGQLSRRDLLTTTSTVTATAITAGLVKTAGYASENSELKVGLIGCGGRGTGAAHQALKADPRNSLVAIADAFMDRAEKSLSRLKRMNNCKVKAEHIFDGLEGYKSVIEMCDVVLLASPPAFRPKHLKYAIENGKHAFCEKPVATDITGLKSVINSCRLAKERNLSIVSGLCYRYDAPKVELMKQVHDGIIGDIHTLQTTYHAGSLWHRGHDPAWTQTEYQLRNWLYFNWLSGDLINEQSIHGLDKIAWAIGDKKPLKVTANGGRHVRTDSRYGNVYDHFNCVYEWEGGIKGFSSCRQWRGAEKQVADYAYGTKGEAAIQHHRIQNRQGDQAWQYKPKAGSRPISMYQHEHNELFRSIREGTPINDGKYMCNSTLMAIMGRMSAYTGKTITYEMVMNSRENLVPEKISFGDMPVSPVAMPGKTKFI